MNRRSMLHRLFRRVGFYLTASALFMLVMLAFFTVFYHYVETLPWLDAFYFTVITTRTIGFGDISPQTAAGKIGTIFNALLPATIFLGASLVVLERIFQGLELAWRDRLMRTHNKHTIIVADPDLLSSIIVECEADSQDFIVVTSVPRKELSQDIQEHLTDKNSFIGDPTEDEDLKNVRVDIASRILIATSSDITNLYVLVTAKSLNPEIKTVVRVNAKKTEAKFRAVGADYMLSTSDMLGRMFLQAAVHPVVHQFLTRLHTSRMDPFIVEYSAEKSQIGMEVRKLFPRSLAVYRAGHYLYDLESEILCSGDIVIGLKDILKEHVR